MKTFLAVAILTLVGSTAASHGPSFSLNAVVRTNQSPSELIEVTVPAGSVATVNLLNDLRLEFAAPAKGDDEQETTTRLLSQAGAEMEILHTTRQGGELGFPRNNAYLVCQDKVTFMSPAPERLPDCGR
jgi:hypothetical protein